MPTENRRQGSAKVPEHVPDLGDPDRKRVLNVLAQRRYRQRRRERIAALEAHSRRITSSSSNNNQSPGQVIGEPAPATSNLSTVNPPAGTNSLEGQDDVICNELELANFDFNHDALDYEMFPEMNLSASSSSSLSMSALSTALPSASGPSIPSFRSTPDLAFPLTSDANMSVPILVAMRAFAQIGTVLGVVDHIYDPFFRHTLAPAQILSLPANLHPTPAQVSIPHHPLFDMIPWPGSREKLICIFALPSSLRPPIARDADSAERTGTFGNGMMQLMHDLDDHTEGLRMHGNTSGWGGSNELDEEAWEIGEKFFRNWWWCLDDRAVDVTNRRRRERGLGKLILQSGNM